MTDHLADARAAFAAAAATGWPEDALTEVISQIIDHLEAQQTSLQPATAPQAAPQPEAGHGDGDEAERDVAREIWRCYVGPNTDPFDQDKHTYAYDIEKVTGAARAALAAAEPHIRAKIADEIEALPNLSIRHFGTRPLPDLIRKDTAARIARQEQP